MESATIFISKIPAEVSEGEVVELFHSVPNSEVTAANFFRKKLFAKNSHYYCGYISYSSPVSQFIAADMYDGLEMRYGKQISVSIKAPKVRIFVGGVPKELAKDQLWEKFIELTPYLKRLVVYNNPIKPEENRGNVFLEYDTPEEAWTGMFELCNQSAIFGTNVKLILDWADPPIEPNDEELNIANTLHVRNIMKSVGEGDLYYVFAQIGQLQKVKKIQDFAFVHYVRRSDAKRAKRELDGIALGGAEIEVLWSKPPSPGITFRNGPPQELLESSQQSGPAYDFTATERQELFESSQQWDPAFDFGAAERQELLESSQQSGLAYDFGAAERQELLESSQESGSAYDFTAAERRELLESSQESGSAYDFTAAERRELLESSQESGSAYDFTAAERQELLESSQESGSAYDFTAAERQELFGSAYDFTAAERQELEDPFQSSSGSSHYHYVTEETLSPGPAVRMILSVPLPQRIYTMPLPPCDCEQCMKDDEIDGDDTEEQETSSIVGGGHSDPDHSEIESDDAAPQPEQYTETEETD